MNLDELRSSAQRFFSNLDARLARTTDSDSMPREEETSAETDRLKELLSVDLEQSRYSKIVEDVPQYGWMALDAARASGLSEDTIDVIKLLNAGPAVGLPQGRHLENERNLGLIQSAVERAIEKERQLMNWSFENGVDLSEEVAGLCQKLKEVEVLLEPGFVERVSKQGEEFFEAFNTHEKLQKHLSEVNTALTRAEELIRILRSQWSKNKSLILSLLPLSGALKMQDLEQRVSGLVKCRLELTHLLQVWTTDKFHSLKAGTLFSNRDYDRALAEEEKISIRRWHDIESSRVRNWVSEKAAEFARTHQIHGYAQLNERMTRDLQFRQEFGSLPRVVSDKISGEGSPEKKDLSFARFFFALMFGLGVVGSVLMLVAYTTSGLEGVHWFLDGRCMLCGREHGLFTLSRSVPEFPEAMATVLGGTLHPGREMRYRKFLVVESYPGKTPDPQVLGTFEIGKYEVTYGEWKKVRAYAADHGYNDLRTAGKGVGSNGNYPVTHVTWYDVVKWCNAKSEMEGRTPVYEVDGATFKNGDYGSIGSTIVTQKVGANGYRLPTGAEWEWAAGGGQSPLYVHSGGNDASAVAWYDHNTNAPQIVGNKKANELGIHDLSGNVSEWCWDPDGGASPKRQVRGGSYRARDTLELQIPQKVFLDADQFFDDVGFRLVRGPVQ